MRAFAKEGAHIGLIARGHDGLEGAKRDVEDLGGKAIMLPTDVADADAVEGAAERVEAEFGPIDVWVNVAMTSVFSPVKEMQPEEYKRVTEVNYLGYVYGTLAALKRMLPRDRGRIIQVGSALAYRGIPLQSAYCASKHAIQGFMDSLRCELIHDGSRVKVCMVQMPGDEHAAVWLGEEPAAEKGAARAADLSARSRGRRHRLRLAQRPARNLCRTAHGRGDRRRQTLPRPARSLPRHGPASKVSKPTNRKIRRQPENLFQPVPGDHGAHGTFDNRSRNWSPQLWTDKHRDAHRPWRARAARRWLRGFLQSRIMSPARELSEARRHDRGEFLAHRPGVAVLALTAMASLALVALYQLGNLKRLRHRPLPPFDTRKVHASDQAYALLDLPDAVLGLGSYAATLGLTPIGGNERAKTHSWIPLALAGKALLDAAQAGKPTRDAWVKHGALSICSFSAAAATLATRPLPEARAAWQRWSR